MSSSGVSLHLRSRYGAFDLDFELESDARSVGVFGPSGSGKTSAIEAVAGWRPVREGRVRLGDRVLLDTSAGIRVPLEERRIGYVPQDALLFPHLSVRRNILAGAHASPADLPRVVEVLEIGALLERLPRALSGGERSRVALARALCSGPEFLLLDEPFGALDLPLRRRILPYLIRVRETFDLPTLFVSHDPTEVQALCDVAAVVESGRVRAVGPPASVLHGRGMPARGYENVLRGRVVAAQSGTATVEVAPGVRIQVPGAGLLPGDRAVFVLGADEILVSIAPLAGISARNVVPANVTEIETHGEDVLLAAALGEGPDRARVQVGLTRVSTHELGLEPGRRVDLVFKTQSCRVLSSTEHGPRDPAPDAGDRPRRGE